MMDGRLATSLGWFFGCSLILVGLWLTGSYFLTGLTLAVLGFFWWPPSRGWILNKLGLPVMPMLHAGLTLCLLVVALFAFLGRYSDQLEAQALEAGYPSLEAWRDAQIEERRQP